MSRVVTSSEVDRLHQQVAELQTQVSELLAFVDSVRDQLLQPSPAQTPQTDAELFAELSELEDLGGASPALFAAPGDTRSDADSLVESIIGRLPNDQAGPSDQDGDFLQP